MNALGSGLFAALALAICVWMLARKKSKVIASWFALVGGLFLGGLVSQLINEGVSVVADTAGSLAGSALGVGAGAVLTVIAVIVCLELYHGMKPGKGKGKASMLTVVLALVAPTLFVAAGGVFADVVGGLTDASNQVGNTIEANLSG